MAIPAMCPGCCGLTHPQQPLVSCRCGNEFLCWSINQDVGLFEIHIGLNGAINMTTGFVLVKQTKQKKNAKNPLKYFQFKQTLNQHIDVHPGR